MVFSAQKSKTHKQRGRTRDQLDHCYALSLSNIPDFLKEKNLRAAFLPHHPFRFGQRKKLLHSEGARPNRWRFHTLRGNPCYNYGSCITVFLYLSVSGSWRIANPFSQTLHENTRIRYNFTTIRCYFAIWKR